jgi:xanthine/uracil permease
MITKEPHKFYVGGGVGCLIQVKKIHLFFIRIPFFVWSSYATFYVLWGMQLHSFYCCLK